MVREFCSKEEVFGGGSAPPLMGAGDGAEICVIFCLYIDRPSADKQVDYEAG